MLTKMTNARKISVKMKAEWSKQLEETGCLICPISGCSQRYVSMANFTTHYKWCSGEKNFGVCPYCESVIFSDRKSTLHHMEVEHPDQIEEYKANYMITEEQEEACAGTSSAVTSFDDDSSDMYVEEVTSKKVGRKPKDRRFYSKENHLTPKRKFFRNKMKNINETVSENIKEFQKCVRFDSIVSKINSVSDSSRTSEILQEATVVKPPRKQSERKPRYILTGNMGEEPSYFDDDLQSSPDISSVPDDPATVKLTTKSKLVLDLQRYKRYNEYLKWTRDWGSERKTYSRSKAQKTSEGEDPDTSHNSTITSLLSSDSFEIQDVHQMISMPDLSNVSLDAEGISQTGLAEHDLLTSAEPTVTAKEVSIFQENLGVDMDGDIIAGNIRTPLEKDSFSEISLLTEPVRDKSSAGNRRPDYEIVSDDFIGGFSGRIPKGSHKRIIRQPIRPINRQPIITFGKKVIPPEKPPVVDFEKFMKMEKRPCHKVTVSEGTSGVSLQISTESTEKSTEVRQPTQLTKLLFPKRKRGRPSKIELEQREELLKIIYQTEQKSKKNPVMADSSSIKKDPGAPSTKGIRGKLGKMRFKGRSKFKSLVGARNKFRGLNRIVYNARKISQESMMRRQAMIYRKVRLSDALTQTDSVGTIDDIQESVDGKNDHNYSTCVAEIHAQSVTDKAGELEHAGKELENALEAPAYEVEVSSNAMASADVNVEMEQIEAMNAPNMNIISEVTVSPEKENDAFNTYKAILTSTPIASSDHPSFVSSSAQDIEQCSIISKVIADFETVTPKPRMKQVSDSTQLSSLVLTSVSTSVPTTVSTSVSTAVSAIDPTTVTTTDSTSVTTTDSTTVTTTDLITVSTTDPISESTTDPTSELSKTITNESSTIPATVSTTVPSTAPTITTINIPTDVPVTGSTISPVNVTSIVTPKASTYIPTIVSLNLPTKVSAAVVPNMPTKVPLSVSSATDTPVQRSFKLNKKLIYHPENQNSREPSLQPREAEKPVLERPITFDELRRSIIESSKVPTSLMAVDSIGACTEVVTQDPKLQTVASSPNKDVPIKRPRGRPKKVREPEAVPTPVKKKGRPRKIRIEVSGDNSILSQTDGESGKDTSAIVNSSTCETPKKPGEEEESMEVDVASEIAKIAQSAAVESVQNEEICSVEGKSIEKDASEDISEKALQNEALEKGTSEPKDSNQGDDQALPEKTEKDSDMAVTSTTTPQVVKLVSHEGDSVVAEKSICTEDSYNTTMSEVANETMTDEAFETPRPPGRRGRKPKRGRKRKIDQTPTVTPTPDPNASPAPPKRRGRPKKVVQTPNLSQSIDGQSSADTTLDRERPEGTTLAATGESSSDTALVGVRKSSRSITKKVVTDYSVLEKTETEAKLVEHVPQPAAPTKSKRGRPRKHPLKEPVPENNAPTIDDPVVATPESEVGVQKRGSRKGRPTKCVDYADLNSGNMDDVSKIIEELGGKSEKKDEVFQGEPEPARSEKVHDDESSLPPKKRKRDSKMFKNSEPPAPVEAVQEVPIQEPSSNQSVAVLEPSSSVVPLEVTKPMEIIPEVYTELFTEYLPVKSMYTLLTDSEYEAYLPPLKQSICFKIKASDAEREWVSLAQFASLPIEESNHYTFFTGGPVSCSAFCPTWEETQYVALCTCSSMLEDNFYDSTSEEKGLIQIWNLGPLTDSGLVRTPTMDLGISHNYGKVLEMTWCPTGAWQDSTKTAESLPRLGLLAAAFSDSCIRIYSVPHPNFLEKDGKKVPLYFASPCITLEPLCEGPCHATSKSSCTALTWQRSNGCEKIAGGYGNGMVCLWLVHSSATICSSDEERVYFPYKIFQAHGTPLTGVSFSPLNDRWIVTCSYDRTMKFFDLLDPSIPFCVVKRGFSRKAHWANNFCGAYVCLHDDVVYKGCSFFKECGTENVSTINLSAPNSLLCTSALSDVLDYYALADVDGTVMVNVLKNMHIDCTKGPCFTSHKIFQTEIVPCDKSSVRIIENEVSSESTDAPIVDPLDSFINSLDSDESDEVSLSNSVLLVQLLDILREQNCELELSVKVKLKALCEPVQDLIDNLQGLDENSYIKFSILDKSFALNREMFDRILVFEVPVCGTISSREEENVDKQSEPACSQMDTEVTSNGESNTEEKKTDSSTNEPTRESQELSTIEELSEQVKESQTPLGGDSDETVTELVSLDESSSKEMEFPFSSELGSEVEIDSNPVVRETECSQLSVSDSNEVEITSNPISKENENVSQTVVSEIAEETGHSLDTFEAKETGSNVEESGEKQSTVFVEISSEGILELSEESISHPPPLDSVEDSSNCPDEKESNKMESSLLLSPAAINTTSSELDSQNDKSILAELSELKGRTDILPDVSGPTEAEHVATDTSTAKENDPNSLISDDPCVMGNELISSHSVEEDSETVCQESSSMVSTVIPVEETPIDSSAQNSSGEISEKVSCSPTEVLIDVDSISKEVRVDSQNPEETVMKPCVDESKSASCDEKAEENLLPCDSTTENSTNSGEKLLAEAVSSSPAMDESMEIDPIPDEELAKQDDAASIASETLDAEFSDFSTDSDSDDSLISECSMETESADSSVPTSPIDFGEESMDTAQNIMFKPICMEEIRSDNGGAPSLNETSKGTRSLLPEEKADDPPAKLPVKEDAIEASLDNLPMTESKSDQDKVSQLVATSSTSACDDKCERISHLSLPSISTTENSTTVEGTEKADFVQHNALVIEASEETNQNISSQPGIRSSDLPSKLCVSEAMDLDSCPQEIESSGGREDVHEEPCIESPTTTCQESETYVKTESTIDDTMVRGDSESISGRTETDKTLETGAVVSESTMYRDENIEEKNEILEVVPESSENSPSISDDTENTDEILEIIESVENIKEELAVFESPESCEIIGLVSNSSDVSATQLKRPPTKRAFLQGLRLTEPESFFNSSKDVKKEEYLANYKKAKSVNEEYEALASNQGLVFRDIFMNDPKDPSKGSCNELSEREVHINSYGISSINTVSWNPNQGSKYWIFSAGNSGLARLSCLSNIASLEQSSRRKKS